MSLISDFRRNIIGSALAPQTLPVGATNGTGTDVSGFTSPVTVVANVGALAGTTPTLDIKVQESADNVTFTDVAGATFAQMTAAGIYSLLVITHVKRYVRTVSTIGGTATPTALTSQLFIGQAKISSSAPGFSVSPQT